jgi:hypothetical protein
MKNSIRKKAVFTLGIALSSGTFCSAQFIRSGTTVLLSNPSTDKISAVTTANLASTNHFNFEASSGSANANLFRIKSGRNDLFTGTLLSIENSINTKFCIKGNGYVGIGTTSPAYLVDVNGISRTTTLYTQTVGNIAGDLNFIVQGYPGGKLAINGSTFLGMNAGVLCTTNNNTAFGAAALGDNTDGDFNTAMGVYALSDNVSAMHNTAIGFMASANSSSPDAGFNTALGALAMADNEGGGNIGIGYYSLRFNEGGENIGIGNQTLYSTTGARNIGIGNQTLYTNQDGNENIGVGVGLTLYQNTTGSRNIAIGSGAMVDNTTGNDNTAVGKDALSGNITGSNNTALGLEAFGLGTAYSNSTALGNATLITASNQVRLGNSSVTSIGGFAGWSNVSDGRVKKEIKENVPGLEFILKLRPVTYFLDHDKIDVLLNTPEKTRASNAATREKQLLQTGFIAQEVEKAAQELGYEFSGVDKPKNSNDCYGLRYAEFTVPLIKAVQEQQHFMEEKDKQMDKLKAQLDSQQAELDKLKTLIKNMTAATVQPNVLTEQPSLGQNTPNPFSETTLINYYLPESVTNAVLTIKTIDGKDVNTYILTEKGQGQISITAGTLQTGTYIYNLVIDGKVVDSKKLILIR